MRSTDKSTQRVRCVPAFVSSFLRSRHGQNLIAQGKPFALAAQQSLKGTAFSI